MVSKIEESFPYAGGGLSNTGSLKNEQEPVRKLNSGGGLRHCQRSFVVNSPRLKAGFPLIQIRYSYVVLNASPPIVKQIGLKSLPNATLYVTFFAANKHYRL